MNKLYFVRDIVENMGVIVSAPNAKVAKAIGYNGDLSYVNSYINVACNVIRGGDYWCLDEHDPMFYVTGQGIVTTDLPTGSIEWQDFINEIKKQGRYEEEEQDE